MDIKHDLRLFADGQSRVALLRNVIGDYCRINADIEFMGVGFTKLDENPGAQSESETYINEVTSSAAITRYETVFPFSTRLIPGTPGYKLWKIGRDHKTGEDAQIEYYRVDLFNPIGEVTEGKAEFTARKFIVSVEVSNTAGNGGEKINIDGNLNAVGDPVLGKFDTVTKTFTEGTFEGKLDAAEAAAAG